MALPCISVCSITTSPCFQEPSFWTTSWALSMTSSVSAALSLRLVDGVHTGVHLLLNTVGAQLSMSEPLFKCLQLFRGWVQALSPNRERPGSDWSSYLSTVTQVDTAEIGVTSAHTNSKCLAPPVTLSGMAEDHLGSKTMPPLMSTGHSMWEMAQTRACHNIWGQQSSHSLD